MFKGIHYVTVDYMLYIHDGWITFSYWKPQYYTEKVKGPPDKAQNKATKPVQTTETAATAPPGKLKKTARLSIFFSHFQLHYYNSWKVDMMGKDIGKQPTTAASTPSPTNGGNTQSASFMRSFSKHSFFKVIIFL